MHRTNALLLVLWACACASGQSSEEAQAVNAEDPAPESEAAAPSPEPTTPEPATPEPMNADTAETAELTHDIAWTLTATPDTVTMSERDALRLTIEVTNTGSETVNPKRHLGQFELDGVVHMGMQLWFGNGKRARTWRALPPGETASDARTPGEQLFTAPGEYVVGFRYGESVATAAVRVLD